MSELTIVVPVCGRPEFSKRFFDRVRGLPFRLLANRSGWLPFPGWIAQIKAMVDRVETPYAMLADNDDVPTIDLKRSVNFLNRNPDYVCASGRVAGFWMWPDLVSGPYSAVAKQYSPYDKPADYKQDDVNERVLAGFANSWSYYGVYRIAALRQIRREVCEMGLTDLRAHEKYCAMRTLTLGKAKCDRKYISYYRQHGTSLGAASYVPPKTNEDFARVVEAICVHGVNKAKLIRRLADWDAAWYGRTHGAEAVVRKRLKAVFPKLAWYVQNRHRYLPHARLPLTGE